MIEPEPQFEQPASPEDPAEAIDPVAALFKSIGIPIGFARRDARMGQLVDFLEGRDDQAALLASALAKLNRSPPANQEK